MATWDGESLRGLPAEVASHVHVRAPLTARHKRSVLFTPAGSPRAPVRRELRSGTFSLGGHRLDVASGASRWDPSAEAGCPAENKSGEAVTLPVCDEAGRGLPASQFLANLRRLSAVQWTGRYEYVPPSNLTTLRDVQEKVGSKVAAMLSVIRDHPDAKHVIIVSKYAGDTPKAYKKELGFAIHRLLGALGPDVMGYAWKPAVDVREHGDRADWTSPATAAGPTPCT